MGFCDDAYPEYCSFHYALEDGEVLCLPQGFTFTLAAGQLVLWGLGFPLTSSKLTRNELAGGKMLTLLLNPSVSIYFNYVLESVLYCDSHTYG